MLRNQRTAKILLILGASASKRLKFNAKDAPADGCATCERARSGVGPVPAK
jgi:hypothetical protein